MAEVFLQMQFLYYFHFFTHHSIAIKWKCKMQGTVKYLSSSLTVTCCKIWTACLWYSSWAWTSAESWLTCSICRLMKGNHALVTTLLSLSSYYCLAHMTQQPLTCSLVLGDAHGHVVSQARKHSFRTNRLRIRKHPYAWKFQYHEEKQHYNPPEDYITLIEQSRA